MTISLPGEIADEIDRRTSNRSRFILEAVQQRLETLRREELRRSLAQPHPDSADVADEDLASWGAATADDAELLDPRGGRSMAWRPGRGWTSRRS